MARGGQASTANFFRDGVTYAGRVASLCASISLALLVGARFYDAWGWIDLGGVPAAGVDPFLTSVGGRAVDKIELGWFSLCKYPVVGASPNGTAAPGSIAPVCDRFRDDHVLDLRSLGSVSDSRVCDALAYADYCDSTHVCEITWFVAGALALIAAAFSEKSDFVALFCFLSLVSIAVCLGYWDKTLRETAEGFNKDATSDEWGLSFRMLQSACAMLVLAVAFAFVDCASPKEADAEYNLMNDGIEITGRVGIVCGILCWVSFAFGYGTTEWFVSDRMVTGVLAADGLNTSSRVSLGLTEWCVTNPAEGVEYCMYYENDPWGEHRKGACAIFSAVNLCEETFNARVVLVSGIVTAFIVDVYSEKMLLNACFGLAAGVLGLYTVVAMDRLADDFNDKYVDTAAGGEELERAEGSWFVIFGLIFCAGQVVLCFLDWVDCFGLKDRCFCLHCGTAGSHKL